jgi:hypothetical protein
MRDLPHGHPAGLRSRHPACHLHLRLGRAACHPERGQPPAAASGSAVGRAAVPARQVQYADPGRGRAGAGGAGVLRPLEATLAELRDRKGGSRSRSAPPIPSRSNGCCPACRRWHRHPELLVTLETTDAPSASRRPPDVAIRFGPATIPACFPSSCSASRSSRWPARACWRAWACRASRPTCCAIPAHARRRRHGAEVGPVVPASRGDGPALRESVRLADTNMTIEAALLGQGVALARSGHVEQELAMAAWCGCSSWPCLPRWPITSSVPRAWSAAARGQFPCLDAGAVTGPPGLPPGARHEDLLMTG